MNKNILQSKNKICMRGVELRGEQGGGRRLVYVITIVSNSKFTQEMQNCTFTMKFKWLSTTNTHTLQLLLECV